MQGMKEIEIGSLNNGAASELFNREMKQVLKNIDDPSTDPKQARKIVLEFSLTPNENREMGVLEIKARSSLAPARATGSTFVLQNDGDKINIFEPNHYQPGLKFDDNTIDFKSRQAGEREE